MQIGKTKALSVRFATRHNIWYRVIRTPEWAQWLRELFSDGPTGRNEFEGTRTQRVYTLVGRGLPFERLAEHPEIVSILDALLLPNYLITASQAIAIEPGETPQPAHTDDSFYLAPRPRPRPAISVSTTWAIDDFTGEKRRNRDDRRKPSVER
jgi:hypothetical protein